MGPLLTISDTLTEAPSRSSLRRAEPLQIAWGKDVLEVWTYARDDRQLHRGNDRFFCSESVALVWRGLVGVAVADDRRYTGHCHLEGVLQEEVFAQAEDRRGVVLQAYQSALRRTQLAIGRAFATIVSPEYYGQFGSDPT